MKGIRGLKIGSLKFDARFESLRGLKQETEGERKANSEVGNSQWAKISIIPIWLIPNRCFKKLRM